MTIKDTAEAWESGALGRDERYVDVVEMEYPTIGEEIEKLKAENERVRLALLEAADMVDEYAQYAGDHLRTKHGVDDDIARFRAIAKSEG